MTRSLLLLLQLWLTLTHRLGAVHRAAAADRRGRRERGDVPGWVMVTIMSAALAVVLITVAGPKLVSLFNDSVDGVAKTPAPKN